jgi:CHAT domain-containing protein/tetratricopeptide (TPR) repeat protein
MLKTQCGVRRFVLRLSTLFFLVPGFTQVGSGVNHADSSLKVWGDTTKLPLDRVAAYNAYIESVSPTINPDSVIVLGNAMKNFSEQHYFEEYVALARQHLSRAYFRTFDIANALEENRLNLAYYQGIRNYPEMVKSYSRIGACYAAWEMPDSSLKYSILALHIANEIKDSAGMITPLINIGHIYFNKHDYILAMEYMNRALKISSITGVNTNSGSIFLNMGNIYFHYGNYDLAMKMYQESRDFYRRRNSVDGISRALSSIASTHFVMQNYALAETCYDSCLYILGERHDESGKISTMTNYAELQRVTGNYDKAIQILNEAISLIDSGGYGIPKNLIYTNISKVYLSEGNVQKAIEYGLMAHNGNSGFVPMTEQISTCRLLYNCYCRNADPANALSYLSELKVMNLVRLGNDYFSMSETEKEMFFSVIEDDLQLYFDFTLHFSDGFIETRDTALTLALATKGLILQSTNHVRRTIMESNDSILIADYENWIHLRDKITRNSAKGNDVAQLEKEARELEKQLILRSGAFANFDKARTLDWKQVRDGLHEGEAAVEFVHFKSEIDSTSPVIYAAFIVKPQSVHPDFVRLCTEDDLKNILGGLQQNGLPLIEKIYGKKTQPNTALYEKIWQPLEPWLQDVKTVYHAPSGLLHKVSFAAICKHQNLFLSDIYNFRQMGSTGNIALENKPDFGPLENFLLMGGVRYNSDSTEKQIWDYLPGSLAETNSINNYLQKQKYGVNYFHSSNATEAVFKEKIASSSIVHIATHGFFFPDPEQVQEEMKGQRDEKETGEIEFRGSTNYANWSFVNNRNPLMRSGIVLANANDVWSRDPLADGEDGILTAQEVSALDLRNTNLVVLSACETGLGDIKGSEGVFGLQRAFKMAGVNYLIMSLWQVPDKETSEFMQLFYKNLLKLKDIPKSFQKTQKIMRQKYDPYYWGAFVLIE